MPWKTQVKPSVTASRKLAKSLATPQMQSVTEQKLSAALLSMVLKLEPRQSVMAQKLLAMLLLTVSKQSVTAQPTSVMLLWTA